MQDYLKRKEAGAVTLKKGAEPTTINISVKAFDSQTGEELEPIVNTIPLEFAEKQQLELKQSLEATKAQIATMEAAVLDGQAFIDDAKAILKGK